VTIPAKVPPGIVDKLKHEKDSEFGLPPMVARAPFFPIYGVGRASPRPPPSIRRAHHLPRSRDAAVPLSLFSASGDRMPL
jgi:hypothetical protein